MEQLRKIAADPCEREGVRERARQLLLGLEAMDAAKIQRVSNYDRPLAPKRASSLARLGMKERKPRAARPSAGKVRDDDE